MNNGVWIRPAGPTFAPTCLVSVVCQTSEVPHVIYTDRTVHELQSIHVATSYHRYGLWRAAEYRRFVCGNDFHDWLESYASVRKRTYVVTPIASNTLTLTGFFDRITERGSVFVKRGTDREASDDSQELTNTGRKSGHDRRAVNSDRSRDRCPHYHFSGLLIGGNTEIVKYRVAGRSLVWTSSRQYFTSTEEEIAKSIGYEWIVSPASSTDGCTARRAADERAFMWLRAFQELCDWWQSIDGGPWGFSTGMLSYSFLRKRIQAKTVLNHSVQYAKELEESGIYGGRRSVWYVGNVGSPDEWERFPSAPKRDMRLPTLLGGISHVDVRSMYPHILATEKFPVRLLSARSDFSVKSLKELLVQYGVIARVRIKTQTPEYPHRRDTDTVYPIGEFRTTLCGRELAAAIANDEIVNVSGAAVYQLGNPFADAATLLLKHRIAAAESKQLVWELFIKHLSNAMAGKLAQRKYSWVERPEVAALREWGQWLSVDMTTGITKRYRAIAGMVFQECESAVKSRPMGAAFCYLTMYGRWMMRSMRQLLPPRSVLAMDTDGIWVRDGSLDYLPIGTEGDQYLPGDVRVTKRATAARFYGPQHYWQNGQWTLSGFSRPTVDPDTLRVTSYEQIAPVSGGSTAPLHVRSERQTLKHLGSLPYGGVQGDDGWVLPPCVLLPPPC